MLQPHLRAGYPLALCALFLCAACSGGASEERGTDESSTEVGAETVGPETTRDPPPAPPDAPSPYACETDADCGVAGSGGPDVSTPCCDSMSTAPSYFSQSYMSWLESYRAASCEGVTCSPSPMPGARMGDCHYEARCAEGVCRHACDMAGAEHSPVGS